MAANGPEIAKAYVQVIPTTKGIKNTLASELGGAGSSGGTAFTSAFKKVALAGIAVAVAKKVTSAVKSAITSSLEAGMNFDAAMSEVGAISGATGESFDALREKAQYMGATTKFSATESAEALTYMAMAGWKTEDMLDGIEGIMHLAAASGEDLALTSDIVTDALTAFGLAAEDSTHFADVLAAASSNANTNVSMLGASFKYAAPVAGALGFSVEDTAVALGLMANAGIKSEMAGTALRGMFTRLAKPTKESGTAMDALGISLTDTAGNMLSFGDIIDDLRNAFFGLSEADAAFYAAQLAGQEAMSGLLAIVGASDEDFDKLTTAIYGSDGAAAQMSKTMQDNLQGDITILNSAIEGLKIAVSDSLQGSLREIVQFGSDSISALTTAFQSDDAIGAAEAFGEILTNALALGVEKLPEFTKLATKVLTTVSTGLIENIPEILGAVALAGAEIAGALISAIIEGIRALFKKKGKNAGDEIGAEIAQGIGAGFNAAMPGIGAGFNAATPEIGTGFNSAMPGMYDSPAVDLNTALKMQAVTAQARLEASVNGNPTGAGAQSDADKMATAVSAAVKDAMKAETTTNVRIYLDSKEIKAGQQRLARAVG